MAEANRKKSLTVELEAARSRAAGYTIALREDADFAPRLRASVRSNQAIWFGGAAALGLVLSLLAPRRRKVEFAKAKKGRNAAENTKRAAFGLTVLKFALDLAKPVIVARVKKYLAARRSNY